MSTSEEGTCYICGGPAEYSCEYCKQLVCDDCMEPSTIHNQIDYCKCKDCEDTHQSLKYQEICREEEREAAIRKKKDKKNAVARERYWKPENVEKRHKAKIERNKAAFEAEMKRMGEVKGFLSNFW